MFAVFHGECLEAALAVAESKDTGGVGEVSGVVDVVAVGEWLLGGLAAVRHQELCIFERIVCIDAEYFCQRLR